MGFSFTRRGLIRFLTFSLAAVLVAVGIAIQSRAEARQWRILLSNQYARSLGELSAGLTNIAADLEKSQYAGTPAQFVHLSARVWRESGGAKEALGNLPMGTLPLDTAYRFLSQAGDYSMALSKKVLSGTPLTEEDRQNGKAIQQAAVSLRDYVDDAVWKYRSGRLLSPARMEADGGAAAVQAGFENLEETITSYPTLIYDGPFSDHLLDRTPVMTANASPVSPAHAKALASIAAGLPPENLTQQDDENSAMPSYVFASNTTCIGISKAGGYLTYLINSRPIGEIRLSQQAVFSRAEQFLKEAGLENMRASYYETADGICTVNYAASQDGILLYPDLIKIGIALDNGAVVFYDARGYLMNHQPRELAPPLLTSQEAAASVSPFLEISSWRLAVIPTPGKNEVFTYEFSAVSKDNPQQQVLVYINAATGEEENILLLVPTPGGTLTK